MQETWIFSKPLRISARRLHPGGHVMSMCEGIFTRGLPPRGLHPGGNVMWMCEGIFTPDALPATLQSTPQDTSSPVRPPPAQHNQIPLHGAFKHGGWT
eukprot:4024915-Prorocentrum_lima.AAC.1